MKRSSPSAKDIQSKLEAAESRRQQGEDDLKQRLSARENHAQEVRARKVAQPAQ